MKVLRSFLNHLSLTAELTVMSSGLNNRPHFSAPRPGGPYRVSLAARRVARTAVDASSVAVGTFRYDHARGRITAYPSQLAGANPRRLQPCRLAGIRQSLWPRSVWF